MFAIDTDQGFKVVNRKNPGDDGPFASEYEGTCHVFNTKFIRCEDLVDLGDAAGIESLVLHTAHGTYSYSINIVQHVATIESQVGTCNKI